ncbi:MAG: ATP-binding cassette domain-containing protein [bacterium]|nr:ATP-binding cassette domain-containing protein [bacterium]MDT8365134.1 ATP-binding cassette domain-containing protein [bacterium]
MNLFTIENLKMELGGREVLNIPGLEVPDGKIVALTGPNGSGKSSFLQILGGLMQPTRGNIRYRDQDLFSQTTAAQDRMRRELGMILQSPYLFKTTVLGNVCYGLTRRGVSRKEAAQKAEAALELVGLGGFGKRPHLALSGGEAQRVALARALVLEPRALLLDEPFANVDAVSRSVIERVLLQENRNQKTSVIFTTHDLDQAYRMADTVVTLFEGRVHKGSMENLFHGLVRHTPDGPVFDTGSIVVAVHAGHEKALTAAIPPESILVSLTPISTSARNILPGRITAARERNGTVDVTVDTGDILIARLTRRSYVEMGLDLGGKVYLVFKAEAVKLY